MYKVLQLHQLLKDLLQWSIDNKRSKLASHWAELGAGCQMIALKELPFKDLMVITKTWYSNRNFKLLEERASRKKENKATIQAMEEQLNQTEDTLIPSGSQGGNQPDFPVAPHISCIRRSVAKSHHFS
ncbi:hypothetical protein O181_035202 [Austropuccinia psidii MF-1]|uniref:Uncharacterized protein n=1 Tax=Austropuccinia psidii MF-1 TaxID=1389203 RepID=A0A9Q3D4R2_9BASI|nr:hypothetical protein [Austropuccinia psidii MF-1]